MRVLAITNMYPTRRTPRAGTFIQQQVEGLRRRGLEVEVVLVDRAGHGAMRYLGTGAAVRRALGGGRWDVAHVMYGGALADLATRALNAVPTVVAFCGVDLLGANYGPLWYRLRTWAGVRCSLLAARRADAIVVKSRNLEAGLPAGVDRRRVHVIPNGVDLDRFRPLEQRECRDRLGWSHERFHVLFSTANPHSKKKRTWLAQAAVAAARARGVPADLHGLSNVPHGDVPVWINAADVLLFTSMYDEGSPNIVKETLACNRPVVSVDVGDVAERVAGIAGCHIVGETPEALSGALAKVYEGPRTVHARERMGELSIEAVADRLHQVYQQAVAAHRSPSSARRPGPSSAAGN